MKRYCWIGAVILLLAISGTNAGNRNAYPLPEERGTAGILAAIQKLPVHVRVLEITPHPDDESAGALTWLSRKFHARTALFCMTRGEGGQNILGPEKYEALGLLRTGELLEACRFYGIDLYFGKAVDFGFSKSAEETLSKWGRREMLADLVLFIRRYRPDIIISRFQGNAGDGHGHHQAAGILAHEAYRAAADLQSFPDQFLDGIPAFQAKKLYVSSAIPESAPPGSDASDWTVRIPVGEYDPVLGRSYREIGTEGYGKHRSQGNGSAFAQPGRAYEYFKLVESPIGVPSKEESLFDSMDTSLRSIFELAGSEKDSVRFLEQDLADSEKAALDALHQFQPSHPEHSAPAIAKGVEVLSGSIKRMESSKLAQPLKGIIIKNLSEKLLDFQNALSAALGIYMLARSEDLTGVPGETEAVTALFYNRGSEAVRLHALSLPRAPGSVVPATTNPPYGELSPGGASVHRFTVETATNARLTEQFWRLTPSKEVPTPEARYFTGPTENEFAPFGPPVIEAQALYSYLNIEIPVRAVVRSQAGDPLRGADFVEYQIVPALSLILEPDLKIVPGRSKNRELKFQVSVLNNRKSGISGAVKLAPPAGWRVQPPELQFALPRKGESFSTGFVVPIPAGTPVGNYPVQAIATAGGQEFRQGYQVVSYPENWTRNFYRPARTNVETFDVATTPNLSAGYIPGAGDDIPAALEQLGVKVQTISASELAFGNLDRYSVIITGIRAYNVNESLRAHNQRLLNYVSRGGTLIVQYVRPLQRPLRGSNGSPFPFGPYPMSVSETDRITVENSPVRILEPLNPVFNRPNKIAESDFVGWVQERGLYFMNSWDPHYKALLSGNDPGEEPKNGGMLMAQYGKGIYIYTAYAWFRQLPAGVPGAFRIFANMISIGRPAGIQLQTTKPQQKAKQ
jgi:LmbE family N-acetylglucosaminyl deacetylase